MPILKRIEFPITFSLNRTQNLWTSFESCVWNFDAQNCICCEWVNFLL